MNALIQTLTSREEKTDEWEFKEVQLVLMDDFILCISRGWKGVKYCHSKASVAKLCKLQVVHSDPDVRDYLFWLALS